MEVTELEEKVSQYSLTELELLDFICSAKCLHGDVHSDTYVTIAVDTSDGHERTFTITFTDKQILSYEA